MKVKAIKITFKNKHYSTIDAKYWTDYEVSNQFLSVKDGETVIAMYAIDEIFSVVLEWF